MLLLLHVQLFLCLACIAWVVMPRPAMALPRSSAARSRWLTLLERIGRSVTRQSRVGEAWRTRLVHAGVSVSAEIFIGMKVIGLAAGLLLTTIVLAELRQFNIAIAFLGMGLGFVVPDLWLKRQLKHKHRAILTLLPEVVDLLALCIGAGLDFLGALRRVSAVKEYGKEPLVEELNVALQEIRFGRRRAEALKAMAQRVNLPELTSFARTVIQADRMGTPIGEVLAVHSEDVRMQRFMRAEREALKAPIKILVPLIFCIMPCVAIIVGAPIFLQFLRQNPFANQ